MPLSSVDADASAMTSSGATPLVTDTERAAVGGVSDGEDDGGVEVVGGGV